MHAIKPGVDVGYMSFSLIYKSVLVVAMDMQLVAM